MAGLLKMADAPRCLARTRAGSLCQLAALKGKRRCRLHGGKGSGAPSGERNGAYKHGGETKEAVALRQSVSRLLKAIRESERA